MFVDYTNKFDSEDENVSNEEVVENSAEEIEDIEEEDEILMGVIYNTPKVNVRPQANTTSDAIKVLDKGTEVFVNDEIEDEDGTVWYSVTLASGQDGFIMKDYVKIVG